MQRLIPVLLVLLTTGFGSLARADAPADSVKYRKAVMTAMAAHFGGFVLVNFGKISQPDHLKQHANALADLGAQTKTLFPAGSDVGETDALPLIWQEQERFAQAVSAVEKATADLKAAANANDKAALAKAFKAAGDSCKGCHDRYRKDDKKK